MTSKPLPVAGRPLSETHVLRSEKLDMKMRPGGKEIETRRLRRRPGTLEFLPNLPVQHHRTLTGKDMVIAYGAQNRIESFRTIDVRTVDRAHRRTRRSAIASRRSRPAS